MHQAAPVSVLAVALAAIFWTIGFIHLLGPRFLDNAFKKWEYGTFARLVTGSLEITAALMLAHPSLRAWGILLAALIMFGAVITLLRHEQYLCAIPSIALMVALVPAIFSIPRADRLHFATIETVSVQTVSGQTIAGTQIAQNGQAL